MIDLKIAREVINQLNGPGPTQYRDDDVRWWYRRLLEEAEGQQVERLYRHKELESLCARNKRLKDEIRHIINDAVEAIGRQSLHEMRGWLQGIERRGRIAIEEDNANKNRMD